MDVPRAVFHTATGMPSTRNGSVPPRVGNTRSGSAEGEPGADTEISVWQAWGSARGLRPSTGSGEYPKGNGRIIHGGVFSAPVQSPPGGRLIARFGRHALIRPPVSLGALRALGGSTWGSGVPRRWRLGTWQVSRSTAGPGVRGDLTEGAKFPYIHTYNHGS